MKILREKPLPQRLGLGLKPDVQVLHPETLDVLKVYEAARFKNGRIYGRELVKQQLYDAASILSHFEEVR
jgi:hypothetical protein